MAAELEPLDPEVRAGRKLYGNDLDEAARMRWYEDEAEGFFNLTRTEFADTAPPRTAGALPYAARNRIDAAPLRGHRYEACVTLGCGEGQDLLTLGLEIGRIVAIEPAREFWHDAIGPIPAEFREPELSGAIDLPDASVDLVVCQAVLHHVANVGFVLAELGRILKPGGRIMVREPIASMGDFRIPRQGLTRHERGIPVRLMRDFLVKAGVRVDSVVLSDTPGPAEAAHKLGFDANAIGWMVHADRIISRALAFNVRYWRDTIWKKIAPRSALYLGTRI